VASGVAYIPGTHNLRFPTVQQNEGNDYNATSGVFICRIAGQYWFSATLMKRYQVHVDFSFCFITMNDVEMLEMSAFPENEHSAGYSYSISTGIHLNIGDRVQIGHCYREDVADNSTKTFFSGVLITPDM